MLEECESPRDDKRNSISMLEQAWAWGAEGKIVQKRCFFLGEGHDNKFWEEHKLNVGEFVVIAQAPRVWLVCKGL